MNERWTSAGVTPARELFRSTRPPISTPKCSAGESGTRAFICFTPTCASWLNMVERFFRDLTQNRFRRGIVRDLEELIMAIGTYIDRHNETPKPFIWTARAADILGKAKRARRTLNKRQSA